MSTSRNAVCPCGSGKKFKHCCWGKVEQKAAAEPPLERRPGSPPTRHAHTQTNLGELLQSGEFSPTLSKEKLRLAFYHARIAGRTSQVNPPLGEVMGTLIPCRRRPDRQDCGEIIESVIEPATDPEEEGPGSIRWLCQGCGDSGTIEGWVGTPFDLRERPGFNDEGELQTDWKSIEVDPTDFRMLCAVSPLTSPALSLLVSSYTCFGLGMTLGGPAEECIAMARCIAVELAYQESLSDSRYHCLAFYHEQFSSMGGIAPHGSLPGMMAEHTIFHRARRREPHLIPDPSKGSCRIRARLLEVSPPVWRTFELLSDIDLEELHICLVMAFGWTGRAEHLFRLEGRRIGKVNGDLSSGVEDERRVRLRDLLCKEGDALLWEYDLGDKWQHKITFEAPLGELSDAPHLVAGEGICPIDTCGGPGGYLELLEIFNDPYNERHDKLIEWLPEHWDPATFSLEKFVERIGRLRSLPDSPS